MVIPSASQTQRIVDRPIRAQKFDALLELDGVGDVWEQRQPRERQYLSWICVDQCILFEIGQGTDRTRTVHDQDGHEYMSRLSEGQTIGRVPFQCIRIQAVQDREWSAREGVVRHMIVDEWM